MLTDTYKKQIEELHATKSWGGAGKSWEPVISDFARELGAKTILDFGAGRQTLEKRLNETRPDLYVASFDPGVPAISILPVEQFDMLTATDVMEHIEPDYLDDVLRLIRDKSRLGAFLNIATGPSKHFLPDGRNVHLIQENGKWWLDRIKKIGGWSRIKKVDAKGVNVWLYK